MKTSVLKRRNQNNSSVPEETVICVSRKSAFGMVIFGLLVMGFGLYLWFVHHDQAGLLATVLGLGLLIWGAKDYTNHSPQIILSTKGIETVSTPFHTWAEITGEQVFSVQRGLDNASFNIYLEYNYPGGKERLEISGLTIDDNELKRLLHLYRKRSENGRP